MKVILLQELKGRGGEGDVIEVARGFAVNYLLPRKVAIEATSGNLKQLEARRHVIQKREDARVAAAGDLATALEGKSVTVEAKVGDEGKLFGSVTAHMIEEAALAQLGIQLDRRKIDTHGPIKVAGAHVVSVSVYRDIHAALTVNVVGEGGAAVVEAAVAEEVAEPEVDEVAADVVADEAAEAVATDEAAE